MRGLYHRRWRRRSCRRQSQAYDDRNYALPPVPPHEMLAYLMETSGRTAKDLLSVFGTRGRVSEFRASVALFI